MDNSRTVLEHKEAFLRTQIRALTAGLEPSDDWRDYGDAGEHGDLKAQAVTDALTKANTIFQKHNASVYSAQAIRHVAEQIDTLYWNYALAETHKLDANVAGLDVGVDMSLSGNIAKLPEQWAQDRATEAILKRYETLQTQLVALDTLRTQRRQQLAQYKNLQKMLKPFETSQDSVQQNLVTRDGQLGQELERMRVLIARVADRVGQLKERPEKERVEEEPMTMDQKLAKAFDYD